MNFSFRIVRLGEINKRCQFYTVLKSGSDATEAEKFLMNRKNNSSPDFKRLKARLRNIKNRQGARYRFFKDEGKDDSLVKALHAGKKKKAGYIEQNDLRWYCIRLSERCVILGNGGVKHVAKTQQDPHLQEKERDMRWVDNVLDHVMREGDLWEDDEGSLNGVLEFTNQKLDAYGLR
jgi:hypothetical protein